MPQEQTAGLVTFVIGDYESRFSIPNVTTQVRRMLEVLGTLTKDGNHYLVECDPDEAMLFTGIMQRLIQSHEATAPEKLPTETKKLALKRA